MKSAATVFSLTTRWYKLFSERSVFMIKFANGIISGVAVGVIIGTGITIAATDTKQRRRMVRDSKRAVRKAGHYFHDMFD